MRKKMFQALVFALLPLMSFAQTESPLPEGRVALQEDFDLPGGDLGPIFEISQDACVNACLSNEACTQLTYNARSNACFPKSGAGEPTPFEGALSGPAIRTDPAVATRARDRAASAQDWLSASDIAAAKAQAREIGQRFPGNGFPADALRDVLNRNDAISDWRRLELQGALVAMTDDAADWADLARDYRDVLGSAEDKSRIRREMLQAATNAWLRADGPAPDYLSLWAQAADEEGRGRDGLLALRSGPAEAPSIAAIIEDFEGRYGFASRDHYVQASGPMPQLCITFSDDIARGQDLRPYVDLPDPTLAVEANGNDLCVSGLPRGQDATIRVRAGLPAASGEALRRDVEITAYIPDRSPEVRFPGRAYVLPASGDLGLTMSTVNTGEVELTLYRMSDRNLVRALREGMFGRPLGGWREQLFTDTLGQSVWQGFATVAPPVGGGEHAINSEVVTRLDLREEAGPLEPGVYALRAAVPNADEDVSPAATQWFMVSDLGLSSFSGTDGLTVAVRGLSDAGPRAGVEVALISRGNAVLGRATTDAEGVAHFDAGLTRGRDAAEPALITATRREGESVADLSFLSLIDPEFDLSDRGVEGNPPAPPIDVFAALDRGAYRAGETAHATILTRDARAAAIDGLPLSAKILRPDGAEFATMMPAPVGDGGYVLNLPIPDTAPRGAWRIEYRVEADGPPLATSRMLVEDFLPERIDFDLRLPEEPIPPQARLGTEINARWLFGAPAAELPVEGELTLRPARSLPDWPGYVFGRQDDTLPQSADMLLGQTDAQGRYAASFDLPPAITASTRPWTAEMQLRVLEGAGRPVERRGEVTILPAQNAIGLKPGFEGDIVPEGSDAGFEVIALAPDGTAISEEIDWTLSRIETQYQWYAIDGDWQWEPVVQRFSAGSGSLSVDDTTPATLSVPVEWGRFELTLKAPNGAETSYQFDAGWGAVASEKETPDRLRVTLDKPAYRIGDTAQVTFEAAANGTALISVLSNRLVAMQIVEAVEGVNRVDLPVTDDWGAGVYVAVSAIRPVGPDAGHAPMRGIGLAPAAVDPADKLLNVSLSAPAEADPRGAAEVTLTVDGAGGETVQATIWAVDQGILNLTGYTPPSASNHYFGQRRLGVGLRDLYGRLILASGAADGAIRSGGDQTAPGPQSPPPTERLMAWFSGPVTLDAQGHATVSVPLPDFNGEVRVMALAWSRRAVGQADTTMLVRDPVVMTATVPQFLAPGDQATAQLSLTHATGPTGAVQLSVTPLDRDVRISATTRDQVELTAGQRIDLPLSLDAPPVEGAAGLRIAATLPDGRTITKDLQIPVMRLDPAITRAMRLTLAPGAAQTPDFSALGDFVPGTGRVSLAAGAYARLNIPAALTLLRDFDYGCTEQIASAAMPTLYAAGLMPENSPARPDTQTRSVDETITQILTRQTTRGGFGLWNARGSDPWLDAFATDFLSRARLQGYEVPDANFRRALTNLQNRLNTATNPEYADPGEAAWMAYAAYVLARERAAVVSDLRYYVDTGASSFATPLAAAQMGAAMAYLGDQPRADRMFSRAALLLEERADPAGRRSDYGTLIRDRAAVMALAAEAGTERVDLNRQADEIASALINRDGGLSTQEAMWIVLAGQAITAGSDPAQGVTLGGAPLSAPIIDLGDAAAPMRQPIANNGDRPVDVTLSATAVPGAPVEAGGNAYAITRSYYTPEGTPMDPALVAQGQRLVTVVEIRPFDEDAEGQIIVTDPLPAGFEIDNPNLIEAGELDDLDWLDLTTDTDMTEFRADRFATSLEIWGGATLRFAYRIRAVTPGSFHHPAATVSDFYRPERRGWTGSGTVVILP
ncbi:alpha-2-macroglobulin family protein [Paracoccus sp. SCSIO 75233]|uniref:alpha-2-macroglobulin family protein n=1 Tax=Paracoccus sp. SCSIO 75233 TaxID=3017782 RepID=UPI0022F063B0|nr:alpha-2-macroglobulin family protein [Paracoccus sp. SCSIO 75233]WBU54585.1 alpha-2-macroglobulin family protein [Paracoccus sp. SCSIO 75233]